MSEIKAIDKLRVSEDAADYQWIRSDYLNQIADEIEAEIAEARETTRKKHRAERVYWQNELHKILDAINGQERFWGDCIDYPLPEATIPPSEIAKRMLAERYMLLPVDANGVPIHVGDGVAKLGGLESQVEGIGCEEVFLRYKGGMLSNCDSDLVHHIKPRTLEDIVQDAIQYGYSHGKVGMDVSEQRDKYADEIRELLGDDAE